ncbi:hypothetical protein D3C78_1096650 [compost metagenome]
MADHRALQGHADGGGDQESDRQGGQRVEVEVAGGELLEGALHQPGGVGAEHQHLAVGHVDHPEQAEGDGQAEGGEQQDGTERQAAEGLAEQFADQQATLDLAQAGLRGLAHHGVAFRAVEQGL